MKVVIQLTPDEETKALPILLRHSPGTILRDRTYIIDADAAKALHDAGIQFSELSREGKRPDLQRAETGERV